MSRSHVRFPTVRSSSARTTRKWPSIVRILHVEYHIFKELAPFTYPTTIYLYIIHTHLYIKHPHTHIHRSVHIHSPLSVMNEPAPWWSLMLRASSLYLFPLDDRPISYRHKKRTLGGAVHRTVINNFTCFYNISFDNYVPELLMLCRFVCDLTAICTRCVCPCNYLTLNSTDVVISSLQLHVIISCWSWWNM